MKTRLPLLEIFTSAVSPITYQGGGGIAYEILTLAGTGHFASFHGTRGGGGTTPLAVSPLIELELRRKKRACSSPRDEEIDIYKLKVLGQPVTSEVRSSAEN